MKFFAWFGIVITMGLLLVAGPGLPAFGDPESAAAGHVSAHFVENAYLDSHTPNIVTVIIADYRGFDTLGEVVVVFVAGLACLFLLRRSNPQQTGHLLRRTDSIIVDLATRVMTPIIQVFALYVIFHGHYSPGGGFQGGALFAGSILLQRVSQGHENSQHTFSRHLDTPFAIAGVLIFAGLGVVTLLAGGNYLQYDQLPLGLRMDMLRNLGILVAEVGVAFAVVGTLVSIFDDLSCTGRGIPRD
ncbi:MAG: sodium:proton antiporter [Acidobacteria bacterium]|nr:sodium:proton antiporter [Acidobacteriota bacterium]